MTAPPAGRTPPVGPSGAAAVHVRDDGPVRVVTLSRPSRRNAVDGPTATALADAFRAFDADDGVSVAVLVGDGGTFCAGADLQALAAGEPRPLAAPGEGDGPMGPTRMRLGKPVVAAVEGHAVAGGLELALWCDLRVAAADAVLGVYCRRFGVPLVDLGTVRLPRLVGRSVAMDLVLTGRGVGAEEALRLGLVNRVAAPGEALTAAVALAHQLAALPQTCLRSDRLALLEGEDLPEAEATANELRRGTEVVASGETLEGATAFRAGAGRSGAPRDR